MVLVLIKVPCNGNVLRGTGLSLKNNNKLSIIEVRKSTGNKIMYYLEQSRNQVYFYQLILLGGGEGTKMD